MIYDDAAWHYRGPFPPELPCEAGATYGGMFLAWAILSGLGNEQHSGAHREKLETRYYLPGQFLVQICAEKLQTIDLNDEGNAFAAEYFKDKYRDDYLRVLSSELPSLYYVEDSWDNYELIGKVLDRRLRKWREAVAFRPAIEADMSFLLELRRTTMSEHQRLSGMEPSDAERLERVLTRFDCANIILKSGEPIGLLKVAKDGSNWKLIQMQLVPSHQGKGIGTGILRNLLREARRSNASISLHVLKTNPARHLYERLGFHTVQESAQAYEMQFGAGLLL